MPELELETPARAEDASAARGEKGAKTGKGEKGGKGAKDKKDAKGGKGAKGEVLEAQGPSIAGHPRAARAVARAKAWAGLVGFGLGAYFSLPTGTLAEALGRALVAGVVGYVAAWAAAVFVWRRLVILELKGREQQLLAAAQQARAPREAVQQPPQRLTARGGGAGGAP